MFTTSYVPKHLSPTPSTLWLVLYAIIMPYQPKHLAFTQKSMIDVLMGKVLYLVRALIIVTIRLANELAPRFHQFVNKANLFFQQIPSNIKFVFKQSSSKATFFCRYASSVKEEIIQKFSNKYFVAKVLCILYAIIGIFGFVTNLSPLTAVSVEQSNTISLDTIEEKHIKIKEDDFQHELFPAQFLQLNNMFMRELQQDKFLSLQLNNDEIPQYFGTENFTYAPVNTEAPEENGHKETHSDEDISSSDEPSAVEDIETVEEIIPTIGAGVEVNGNFYSISPVLYVHIGSNPKAPLEVSTTRISDEDIMVDLSNPFEDRFIYNINDELKKAISRLTFAESGNQPFDGQLSVAEDIRNSLFSGVYGGDLDATCRKQFFTSLIIDADGTVHLYRNGAELLQTTDSTDAAAELAVQGTNITGKILEVCTAIRSEQYPNWDLNESYFTSGAYFHYAPARLDGKQLSSRVIGQVPVSFSIAEHVFYAKWLNAKYALSE